MSTIESLENDFWGNPPSDATNLMISIYSLRQKSIEDFSTENLRLLIGQNIALDILIPKAISVLEENILAEGDYYRGDLLKAVIECNRDYWTKHPEEKGNVVSIINTGINSLQEEIPQSVFKQVTEFIR